MMLMKMATTDMLMLTTVAFKLMFKITVLMKGTSRELHMAIAVSMTTSMKKTVSLTLPAPWQTGNRSSRPMNFRGSMVLLSVRLSTQRSSDKTHEMNK